MRHIGPKMHKFVYGFFRRSDHGEVRYLYAQIQEQLANHGVTTKQGIERKASKIADDVASTLRLSRRDYETVHTFVQGLFDYEELFLIPHVDFKIERSVSEYWALKDQLNETKAFLNQYSEIIDATTKFTLSVFSNLLPPNREETTGTDPRDGLIFKAERIDHLTQIDARIEEMLGAAFADDIEHLGILKRLGNRLETNLVVASGGNPGEPKAFNRQVKPPTKFEDKNPDALIATYLGGTPLADIFDGEEEFIIPTLSRYEHHHIVAGTGHGKTQTLQYLISQDLKEVERGNRSIVVIDSQGDLINKIRNLEVFAPGEPLHDRICIIDPEDIEYPVSLNLFDVGQDRLKDYEPLQREQLTNSILELYDFVLGSLLEAEMTQKQQVLFNFVTKLMLEIPGATIHTFRDIFAAKDASGFMDAVNKLDKTAKQFFLTEFKEKDFAQTKSQVNRRLLGIMGDRNFERMFSHPKSKFDLFTEMNSGKVILINTAKRLLKASGSELLGRFFIALISQAAQERSVIPENRRMPTFVYIDEAADYFDRNIEMILREARKYKVGMILAHQYLGQLDNKLQEAFSANTTVKFAGGVSSKDAATLSRQMNTDAAMLETQPKLSFAAFVKGRSPSAVSLKVPYGVMEAMDTMTEIDADDLRDLMREKYATQWDFDDYNYETPEEPETDIEVADDQNDLDVEILTSEKANEPEKISQRKDKSSPELTKPEDKKLLGKPDPENPDTPDTDPSDKF